MSDRQAAFAESALRAAAREVHDLVTAVWSDGNALKHPCLVCSGEHVHMLGCVVDTLGVILDAAPSGYTEEDVEWLRVDLSVSPSRPDLDAQYVIVNREALTNVLAALGGGA